MKVVAFNESPVKTGNTYHGIKIVIDEIEKEVNYYGKLK